MAIFLWPGIAPDTELCGDQAQPSLEPFVVEGSKGAVIVCPGGAYVNKAAHEGVPIAEMLNEAGISAFVLDYRVKPFRIETAVGDAHRAIRMVRSMGYEKVGILGFSAGGHLAGSAATLYDSGNPDAEDPIERLSSRPDAFVSCYGATSFRLFQKSWTPQVLGKERMSNQADINRYTAELNITKDTPPAFIWHTADDPVVPVEVALVLAEALSAKGVLFELHVYPHGAHGLGLAKDDPVVGRWTGQVQRWLRGLGFGKE